MTKPSFGILKFHMIDTRQAYIIFWSIMVLTLTAGLFIGFQFENAKLFYATSFAIYIYAGFAGFLTLKQSFPHMISLGLTRKNFFFNIMIAFILVSALMSLTHNVLFSLLNLVKKSLAIESVMLFHTTMIGNIIDTWVMRFFIDFSVSFLLMTFFFFVASLHFRYGLTIVSLFGAILLTFLLVLGTTDYLMEFILLLTGSEALLYYGLLIALSLILSFLSWLVMKRSSVEQKIA